MNLDPLNKDELKRNNEKSDHEHNWYLKFKTHFNIVMILTLWLYFILLFLTILNLILPAEMQFIDHIKIGLMIDTIIKLSIGALIGKISNILSK